MHELSKYKEYYNGVIYIDEILMLSLIDNMSELRWIKDYRVDPLRSPKKSWISYL